MVDDEGEMEETPDSLEDKKLKEELDKVFKDLKEPMWCFRNLHKREEPMFEMMKIFGRKVVPLSVVGMFMNYAGNHMLAYISNYLLRDKSAADR